MEINIAVKVQSAVSTSCEVGACITNINSIVERDNVIKRFKRFIRNDEAIQSTLNPNQYSPVIVTIRRTDDIYDIPTAIACLINTGPRIYTLACGYKLRILKSYDYENAVKTAIAQAITSTCEKCHI